MIVNPCNPDHSGNYSRGEGRVLDVRNQNNYQSYKIDMTILDSHGGDCRDLDSIGILWSDLPRMPQDRDVLEYSELIVDSRPRSPFKHLMKDPAYV